MAKNYQASQIAGCQRVHFIGCGGAGMAPLAMLLATRGVEVSGSDLKVSANTAALEQMGCALAIGPQEAANLPLTTRPMLVVRSSAVGEDNPELAAAIGAGHAVMRRGEALAAWAATYRRPVAVSGSHGKTTVTALIAHILRQSLGATAGYLVGGKTRGFPNAAAGAGDIFICEVDESDGTHALVKTSLGVVTNVEDDHWWSVGGREALRANFQRFAAGAACLLVPAVSAAPFAGHPNLHAVDCESPDLPPSLLGFERTNAALALATATRLGVDAAAAVAAIGSFPGVERRMTIHRDAEGIAVVEDYAHHPSELAAALEVLRLRFPGRELRVVFQPHRVARLRSYFDDFVRVLRTADKVVLSPVFAAWCEGDTGAAAELAAAVGGECRFVDGGWAAVAAAAAESIKPPTIVAVIGAGDIDEVIPKLLEILISPINASGKILTGLTGLTG